MGWRERRQIARMLRNSSLDPANLYIECEPCRLAGRGNWVARDPFDDRMCVYGHAIEKGGE